MARRPSDITGTVFGGFIALRPAGKSPNGCALWAFACLGCGDVVVARPCDARRRSGCRRCLVRDRAAARGQAAGASGAPRREEARRLREEGRTLEEVGALLGVSRQRVYQLLTEGG